MHLTEHPRGLTLARLLRPRYAVTRERDKRAALWRRHFTHFYRLPARTERHVVEQNLDALRRIGVYPDEADRRLVLVPGAAAERKVARAPRRSTGSRRASSCRCIRARAGSSSAGRPSARRR